MRLNPEGRAFRAKVDKALAPLSFYKPPHGFFVYLISDPRTASKIKGTDAMPFYVGQTSHMVRRARKHLADGGSAEVKAPLHRRIYAILREQLVPSFAVLETTTTRLAALEAERKWALALNTQGHILLNEWAEHRVHPLKKYADGTSVPTLRLWDMTIEEAQRSGIKLALQCRFCNLYVELPTDEVRKRCPLGTRLYRLKFAHVCPQCGKASYLEIVR